MKDKNTPVTKATLDPFIARVMELNRKAAEIAKRNLEASPYRH
jgi:hypothetical protein